MQKIKEKLFSQPENPHALSPIQRKCFGFGSIVLGVLMCVITLSKTYSWQFTLAAILLNTAFFANLAIFAFANHKLSEKQRRLMLICGVILAILGNVFIQIIPKN